MHSVPLTCDIYIYKHILYHSEVTYLQTRYSPYNVIVFIFSPFLILMLYLISLNLQWGLYANILDEDIASKFTSLVRISLLNQV